MLITASTIPAVLPAQAAAVIAAPSAPPTTGFTTVSLLGFQLTINPMVIVLLVGLLLFGWIFWKAQTSDKPFDIRDLVFVNGHLDIARTLLILCFAMSSWVIVNAQITHTLTEGLFQTYEWAWALTLIAAVIFGAKELPNVANFLDGKKDDQK